MAVGGPSGCLPLTRVLDPGLSRSWMLRLLRLSVVARVSRSVTGARAVTVTVLTVGWTVEALESAGERS